jgi:hypothetical protein
MGGKKALWLLFRNNIPRIFSMGSTILIIITQSLILAENHKIVVFDGEGNSCGFIEYVCSLPPPANTQY